MPRLMLVAPILTTQMERIFTWNVAEPDGDGWIMLSDLTLQVQFILLSGSYPNQA